MDATLRVGENDRMPEDSTCRNADRFQTLCFINSFRKSRVVRFFLKSLQQTDFCMFSSVSKTTVNK